MSDVNQTTQPNHIFGSATKQFTHLKRIQRNAVLNTSQSHLQFIIGYVVCNANINIDTKKEIASNKKR